MKKILFLFFLMSASLAEGQTTILVDGGQMSAGKSIRFGAEQVINKSFSIAGGINYHLNNLNKYDSRGFAYLYRMHAYNERQHFGLFSSVSLKLFETKQGASVGLIADINFHQIGLKANYISQEDVIQDSLGNNFLPTWESRHANMFHVQTTLGLEAKAVITEWFGLRVAVGTGPTFIKGSRFIVVDPILGMQNRLGIRTWFIDAPFSPFVRVGAWVQIPKKAKS